MAETSRLLAGINLGIWRLSGTADGRRSEPALAVLIGNDLALGDLAWLGNAARSGQRHQHP
jgi:hypothetical protein